MGGGGRFSTSFTLVFRFGLRFAEHKVPASIIIINRMAISVFPVNNYPHSVYPCKLCLKCLCA